MLILLPPSEGKASQGTGEKLDLDTLSFPDLTSAREKVIDALVELSHSPDARAVLGLSAGQTAELDKNRDLRTAPTLAAADLYTGVLYDNLGLATLSDAARERANESVIVFSGLWGALRLTDRIPPYRLSMGVKLPPMGGLAAFWRPSLRALFPRAALILDMRSATYAQAWQAGARSVAVRVLRETAGKRAVVSHMAKATRGSVARSLLESPVQPENAQELVELLATLGYHVEASAAALATNPMHPNPMHPNYQTHANKPAHTGKPTTIDIVINS